MRIAVFLLVNAVLVRGKHHRLRVSDVLVASRARFLRIEQHLHLSLGFITIHGHDLDFALFIGLERHPLVVNSAELRLLSLLAHDFGAGFLAALGRARVGRLVMRHPILSSAWHSLSLYLDPCNAAGLLKGVLLLWRYYIAHR